MNEAGILIQQIRNMNANLHSGSQFLVHLGDFNRPENSNCAASHFQSVSDILRNGPLPTLVLAGDNDFIECPNVTDAWDRYLTTFARDFEQGWSGASMMNVTRWNYLAQVDGYERLLSRPDMFSFYREGILFVSLALLNMKNAAPDDAFYQREAESLWWLTRHLDEYQDRGIRGVVLFSHAEESHDLDNFFEIDLKGAFSTRNITVPVIYLCGDSHRWDIDVGKYSDWSQFTYVSVDRGACADPLHIEIAPVVNGVTQHLSQGEGSRQYVVGDGLFRIDRQSGRYAINDCD